MSAYPLYPARICRDLAGFWDFQFVSQNETTVPTLEPVSANLTYPEKQTVPGCFDAAGTHAGARGTGVYRRRVDITRSGRVRLEIGGLMLAGRIFWDGSEIGSDLLPYSGTAYEWETIAGTHELVITVENRVNTPFNPLFQANYAFRTYAGILRSIRLMELPDLRFGRAAVTTLDLASGHVRLDINFPNTAENTRLAVNVCFDDSEPVTREVCVRNNTASADFYVPNPQPWSPEHPVLHTVRLALPDGGDILVERFGLRTIEAKNAKLYLNGQELFLRGVNRHDAHPEFGNAVPPAILLEDLQILRSMHCNFVRGCHYPQSQLFLDLCDEMGFLVWEESIGWGNSKNDLTYDVFRKRQIEQTALMVRNSRNHPSVILWGFLNEVDSTIPEARSLITELVGTVKNIDSSRLVSFASNHVGRGDICLDLADVIACNTYPGWYETYLYEENCTAHVKKRFDAIINAVSTPELKDKPLIISELGAAAIYGYHDRARIPWSEEFQADLLAETCTQLKSHPRIRGIAFWQFADTCSLVQGGSSQARGFNNKGLVNEYRQEKLAADTVRRAFADLEQNNSETSILTDCES